MVSMATYGLIAFRLITIMALALAVTLLIMGKRPIGELPVFDFLTIVVMGAAVGADIADPNIEHLPTAFTVVTLGFLQLGVSRATLAWRRAGKWTTFEPVVVIQNGTRVPGP